MKFLLETRFFWGLLVTVVGVGIGGYLIDYVYEIYNRGIFGVLVGVPIIIFALWLGKKIALPET